MSVTETKCCSEWAFCVIVGTGEVDNSMSITSVERWCGVSGFEITCANKNRSGSIVRVGGVGWSLAIADAITKLLSSQIRLTIRIDGNMADVGIRGNGPDAYLAIEPDGFPLHQLADLPSC
jgi:hypothetical protein